MTSETPSFSLVIPCYNESASLDELVARARFTAAVGHGEVILVDNGSTDDTAGRLASLIPPDDPGVRVVTVATNRGYGFGVLSGLEVARGRFVGWTHADLQTDPADVLRVLPALRSRSFAKGRRYGRPFADRIFTTGMSVFESVLLRTRVRDINAQPTLFDRTLSDAWSNPPHDFSLDLFAYYSARKQKYTILRFPVIFAPRRHGTSSWNVDLRSKWKFIKRTIGYSLALRKSL